MRAHLRPSPQQGFTLIELSIALVVIGLIIGSVLVGVNILNSARVTNAVNVLQSVQSAVSTYNQNYGALPGDDKQAQDRFSSKGIANSGGGNGSIGTSSSFEGTAAAASGDTGYESVLVWADLRAAGLVKGDVVQGSGETQTIAPPPSNPFGGIVGIQSTAFAGELGGNVVCLNRVPGAQARVIDQRLDDGNATKGNVRGGTAIGSASAAYVDETATILCTGL